MTPEIEKLALELRGMIGQARSINDTTDFNRVFTVAENIVGTLAYLIGPIITLEQKYRMKVLEFKDKDMSMAEAEARGKASDEYVEWRKYNMLYELGHEQILILKKFQTKLTDEYSHS